jgi:hypothetical protein
MSKKSHGKAMKKKLTKKEQKAINHLRLIHGKKGESTPVASTEDQQFNKKAA